MPTEIERKFLVNGDTWKTVPGTQYRQGYLNQDKERTVRVRIAGEQGFLTIKGKSVGASRAEFEYEIPLTDAQQMMALCEGPLVEKIRYRVPYGGMVWEVDEFQGDNAGLVIAEIELQTEDQPFEIPEWAGREVTEDPRYFNSNLSVNPFSRWKSPTPLFP